MTKKTTIAALMIAALLALSGCAIAAATDTPVDKQPTEFVFVHDWSEPKVPSGAVRIAQEQEAKAAEIAAQEAAEEEAYYEEYYEPVYYSAWAGSGDGFMQEGVREYDGRTESWYSSNQAYHKDTAQWTVDDEGYYRDDDGHYVVAASDMDYGTVFEGSKGECIVLDDGCSDGVTDYYVAWG